MGTEPASNQGPGKIEVGDFTIQSSDSTQEQLEEQFKDEIDKDAKEAASKLGKKGAKARKEKAEEPEEAEEKQASEEKESSEEPQAPKKKAKQSEEDEEASEEKKASESEPEDDEGESEGEDEEPEKKKKLGKPKHDPRARMLQATRQAAEAKRERDAALARVDELAARLERLEKGSRPEPEKTEKAESQSQARESKKPDPSEFDDYETYLDARDEWNLQRWTQKAQEEAQMRAQMSQQDRAMAAAVEKFSNAVGHAEGWEELAASLTAEFQLPEGTPAKGENWIANELVFNPESAPSLGLYLQEHEDEFQRIAALSTPRDVSRAMAKLEARLEAATAGTSPEPEEKSKAAPPVKPVKGSPYVSGGPEGPKPGEDFDSWFKRTKQKIPRR